MRGVSKRHRSLNIKEIVPEGTSASPRAVSFSAALTLTYRRLPGSNSGVTDMTGDCLRGEKTWGPCISSTCRRPRRVPAFPRLHTGALGAHSFSHSRISWGMRVWKCIWVCVCVCVCADNTWFPAGFMGGQRVLLCLGGECVRAVSQINFLNHVD